MSNQTMMAQMSGKGGFIAALDQSGGSTPKALAQYGVPETPATREQHSRSDLRYSTDLTDAEWAVLEPLLPSANPLGRPRLWSLRDIVNGIFFVLRGGLPWRLLPKDLPPKSTVYGYFSA